MAPKLLVCHFITFHFLLFLGRFVKLQNFTLSCKLGRIWISKEVLLCKSLTNDGIEHLQTYMSLPYEIVPTILMKLSKFLHSNN